MLLGLPAVAQDAEKPQPNSVNRVPRELLQAAPAVARSLTARLVETAVRFSLALPPLRTVEALARLRSKPHMFSLRM